MGITPMNNLREHARMGIILTGAFTLLVALAIRFNVVEVLRGGYGWQWPYVPVEVLRVIPLVIALAWYMFGAWLLLRRPVRARYSVIWTALGTLVIVLAALLVRHSNLIDALFSLTASQLGTGQHWVSTHIDWAGGAWRDWGAQITSFGGHLSNLPPGAILWYALLSGMLDSMPGVAAPVQGWLLPLQCHNYALLVYTPGQWSSALFGMAMPVWAALTPIPLYFVLKQIAPRNARAAVLWYPFIPALSGFAGTWNTLYPLIAVLALLTLMRGCRAERINPGWIFASGLLTGVGWFINFALVPLVLFLGIWVLVAELIVPRRSFMRAILIGVVYGIGLLPIWIVFWFVSGQTIFDLMAAGLSFHLTLDRPYWFWVFLHPWDWLMWGGVSFGIVALVLIGRWIRGGVTNRAALPVMSVTLIATMLMLVISGTARGETGRVWLFFSPFLLVAAAEYRRDEGLRVAEWLWLGVPQAALVVALISSIASSSTDFTPPPAPPQVRTTYVADAMFSNTGSSGSFRLVGWDAEIVGDMLTLRLNWQGVEPSRQPIWFGGVLVSAENAVVPLAPWQPGGASPYPTTCWSPGTMIGDTLTVKLDQPLTGEWWLSLAAYGNPAQPEGRLSVRSTAGDDTQIGLGPIQ